MNAREDWRNGMGCIESLPEPKRHARTFWEDLAERMAKQIQDEVEKVFSKAFWHPASATVLMVPWVESTLSYRFEPERVKDCRP